MGCRSGSPHGTEDVNRCATLLHRPQAPFPGPITPMHFPPPLRLVFTGIRGAAHLTPTQAQPSSMVGLCRHLRSWAPGTAGNLLRPTSEMPTLAPCTPSQCPSAERPRLTGYCLTRPSKHLSRVHKGICCSATAQGLERPGMPGWLQKRGASTLRSNTAAGHWQALERIGVGGAGSVHRAPGPLSELVFINVGVQESV